MDELNTAVEAALKGNLAEQALAAQRRQMREWGITMPPGQAVVFDFGLGRFDGDHVIGPGDAAIMAGNRGYGTGEGATGVPEPSAIALLLGLPLAMLFRRRK